MLQFGVPLLDDGKHFIERLDERSHLGIACFLRAYQVILFFRDDFGCVGQVQYWLGNERLQLVRYQKRDQARNQHNHGKRVELTIGPSPQLVGHVRPEVHRAEPYPGTGDNGPENHQVIVLETILDSGRPVGN